MEPLRRDEIRLDTDPETGYREMRFLTVGPLGDFQTILEFEPYRNESGEYQISNLEISTRNGGLPLPDNFYHEIGLILKKYLSRCGVKGIDTVEIVEKVQTYFWDDGEEYTTLDVKVNKKN